MNHKEKFMLFVFLSTLGARSRNAFGLAAFRGDLKKEIATFAMMAALVAVGSEKIDGWRGAKWGMTEREILSAFPDAVKLPEPSRMMDRRIVTVQIETVKVLEKPFRVRFLMGEKGPRLTAEEAKMSRVRRLSVETNAPLTGVLLALSESEASNVEPIFESLERSLREKYGAPLYQHDEAKRVTMSKMRHWKAGNTRIELNWTELGLPHGTHLNVAYEKINPDPNL